MTVPEQQQGLPLLLETLPTADSVRAKPIAQPNPKRPSPRLQPRTGKRSTAKQPSLLHALLPPPPIPTQERQSVEVPSSPKPLRENRPEGWVDPDDSNLNDLKNCYRCGWPIKISGLDHSLCSGNCGWVVDRIWKKRQDELDAAKQRRRSSLTKAQAATHTDQVERHEVDALFDLFTDGLDTSEMDGSES